MALSILVPWMAGVIWLRDHWAHSPSRMRAPNAGLAAVLAGSHAYAWLR